jgi:hypothetical protein
VTNYYVRRAIAASSSRAPDTQLCQCGTRRTLTPAGIALQDFQRRADVRRQIDLVDVQRDKPGTALARNLVARGDIDHIQR